MSYRSDPCPGCGAKTPRESWKRYCTECFILMKKTGVDPGAERLANEMLRKDAVRRGQLRKRKRKRA